MKKGLGFGLLFLALGANLGIAQAASTDDIILQSKVDAPTLDWLINKTQVLMSNANLSPLLTGVAAVTQTPTFTFAELSSDPNFTALVQTVGQVFHVDTSQASLRVTIPKVSYNLGTLSANPTSLQVADPLLTINAGVSISGLDIGLPSGIVLDLMIPNPTTQVPESILTATLDPASVSIPNTLPPITFDIGLQAMRDQQIAFNVQSENLDSLPNYVRTYESQLVIKDVATNGPVTVNQIHVNPVTINLGPLSRTFTFDQFKPLVQSKLNDIIAQVLYSVGNGLKTDIGPYVLAQVFSNKISSSFSFSNAGIFAEYQTSSFAEPAADQVSFSLTGTTCTSALYTQYQQNCVTHALPLTPVRVITDADHATAKTEITAKIESGAAKVAVSLSEEYLNRLLKTTIDADLWNTELAAQHLTLGPKGAFVVFDQASNSPQIFLDLNYTGDGSFLQNLIISPTRPIHFPLRMSTALTFVVANGEPSLTIKIGKVLSDANEIMNGISQYGLSSQLITGLKGVVAKMIIKMASSLDGETALNLDLPILKNMDVETTSFEVSAHGRLNIYFVP